VKNKPTKPNVISMGNKSLMIQADGSVYLYSPRGWRRIKDPIVLQALAEHIHRSA